MKPACKWVVAAAAATVEIDQDSCVCSAQHTREYAHRQMTKYAHVMFAWAVRTLGTSLSTV